jgi:hypothetical protein
MSEELDGLRSQLRDEQRTLDAVMRQCEGGRSRYSTKTL